MLTLLKYSVGLMQMEEVSALDVRSVESDQISINEAFVKALKLSFQLKKIHDKFENQLTKKKKKQMIRTIETTTTDALIQNLTNTNIDEIVIVAIVYLNIGLTYSNSTEEKEINVGKSYFMKCKKLLKGKELEPKAILTAIRVLIELNFISTKLPESESESFIDEAMELYLKYTNEETEYSHPINIPNIFGIEDESNSQLSLFELHLITLDKLVHQYQVWPNDKDTLVIHVHKLLERNLRQILKSRKLECGHWALASIELTYYFINNHRFIEARHHLAAAEYVLERFKSGLTDVLPGDPRLDKYHEVHASISKMWGIYGVALLYLSKDRLCQENSKSCETDNSESESLMNLEKKPMNLLLFSDLDKDLESITSKITDTYISNYNDAKVVFTMVLKWLNEAKLYFTMERDYLSYQKIMLESANAYKYFCYYIPNKAQQKKLRKLQIDILEKLIEALNSKAGTKKTDIEVMNEQEIRQITTFHLGIAYSSLLDINIDITINDECLEPKHDTYSNIQLFMERAKKYLEYYLSSAFNL